MTKNDGGPAFPVPNEQRYEDPVHGVIRPSDIYGEGHTGMSLRDWFAGMALRVRYGDGTAMTPEDAAVMAYQLADAMLAAREVTR
jgi:hypothetical protein